MMMLSALESTVLPIPLEVVLVPMMLKFPDARWKLAAAALAGCLAGAVGGYYIGYFLMDTIGNSIITGLGIASDVESFRNTFNKHAFWAVLAVGVSPMPFQAAMLVAGASKFSLWLFLLATLFARSLRYLGLAWLVGKYGKKTLEMWREHKLKTSFIALAAVIAIWGIFQLIDRWFFQ